MPIGGIFAALPDKYSFTQHQRDIITQSLTEFLGLKTPPTSLLLKSPDGHLVCGIANQNRFFVGALSDLSGAPTFSVRHVTNTDDIDSKYDINVRKLCGF